MVAHTLFIIGIFLLFYLVVVVPLKYLAKRRHRKLTNLPLAGDDRFDRELNDYYFQKEFIWKEW